jgi:hypothetical protein
MMIKIKQLVTAQLPAILLMAFIILSPMFGIAQSPGSPNGNGSQPPLEGGAVPFDDNMNLVFLAAGIAFAVMITVKKLRKKEVIIK